MESTHLDHVSLDMIPDEWQDDAIFTGTLNAMRELRLFALQNDPFSFSSTYARESVFSEDQWRERLLKPTVRHVAASRPRSGETGTGPTYSTGEWVGAVLFVRSEPTAGEDYVYAINAMFVHPSFRGCGLGRRLVEMILAAIKEDHHARSKGPFRVMVEADSCNKAAIALYERCGFQVDRVEPGHAGGQLREHVVMSQILNTT